MVSSISLKYDGEVHIATFSSRMVKRGKNKSLQWSEFLDSVLTTTKTKETLQEYMKMSKDEQDRIKDVGAYVGGWLKEGSRKAENLEHRTLLTLDADFAQPDLVDTVDLVYGCAVAAYPTHKHTPEKPRLRLVIPLRRQVSAEEYEAVGRRVAYDLGMEQFDDTTYQPTRIMYYPSTAANGEFKPEFRDAPWLDPDMVLAQYPDWRDTSYWPVAARAEDARKREAKKQGNPLEKPGLIGAFCRCYDVETAIDKFLPGVYTPCALPGRYTYAKGSTAAGLVVYDGGEFVYSNHATDPISGRLCNAFDLVRIHLYGERDEDVPQDTPINRRPSFLAMSDLAAADAAVKRLLNKERLDRARADFEGSAEPDDDNWADELEVDRKGKVLSTIDNAYIIMRHDPLLKGAIAYNDLKVRPVALRSLPWREVMDTVNGSTWSDSDDAALRRYLEKYYKLTGKEKIMDGMITAAKDNTINPIENYLDGLTWDGVERLDALLVDYLGAEDTAYVRAVTRKTFTAAVARIYDPGCKFDYVLTLSGPQGRGKSTLVAKMSNGWYTDSLAGIGTKEAYEGIQGFWLVELGELAAMRKIEIETTKNFISKMVDSYRAAYGRRVEDHPRRCVFIGTTNSTAFLRDDTGNRRFWPVRLGEAAPSKTVWGDLTQPVIDQMWAEAVTRYRAGEKLTLPPELVESAQEQQQDFTEDDPRRGLVEDYLEVLLPTSWAGMSAEKRRGWFQEDDSIREAGTVRRDYISAVEVWAECFGNDPHRFPRQDRAEVNAILQQLRGWKEEPKRQRCGPYGQQTRFRRVS